MPMSPRESGLQFQVVSYWDSINLNILALNKWAFQNALPSNTLKVI